MPAPERKVYLLSSKNLSPETIAVAFAKTSRFPNTFREIASELTDEKSAQFHEKWVVGYGHASVAEHAVLHLAIENASRIAMEAIESNRLASYTEKSTRYQKWDMDSFYTPDELIGHSFHDQYVSTCRKLFDTYKASLDPIKAVIAENNPRKDHETNEAYDRRIRSHYVDVCRFILPAASLANVGMTANGRVIENSIRKWLSSPLAEIRAIGETVKKVAQEELPTLVKYADAVKYLVDTPQNILQAAAQHGTETTTSDWCHLVAHDHNGEDKVLAATLYRFGYTSYSDVLEKSNNKTEREKIARILFENLNRHDVPLRELEHCTYTFDLVMDQGAYAEFKRHRMMTQTPQLQTTLLGYATPRLITEAGFESQYDATMSEAHSMWMKLKEFNPHIAQYVVPNAFNRRVLATFNLREAYAFCQLRAASNAHFSIRRIAQRMHEEIAYVHPLLARYMRLPDETWNSIDEQFFTKTE